MPLLPTLMIKGRLVPPDGDPKLKKELDEWVPIDYIIEWFRSRLNKTGINNRVLILKSETASGKSTAFPPELYKSLVRGTDRPGIICTQPRVMTAIENVIDMLKYYSKFLRLGETIGWSTKYNKLRPTSVGLLSATVGTLAQQLRTSSDEEIMKKYRFILIDETHERDLQTDITIAMLKNLLMRNRNNVNCPFVTLMSATFDPQSFLDYFKVSLRDNFIWCTGATAKIDEMWHWNEDRTVNNFPQAAAIVVEKIVTENPDDDPSRADILIFMPGKAEFKLVYEWLQKLNKKLADAGRPVLSILQIESVAVQTRNLDFMRALYIPVQEHEVIISGVKYIPARRVIISTNVAETGLTLDNLKYVIDGGYNREIEYNPVLGIRGLITKPAPKSRIRQRRGRVGRKFPGVFYPLYPQYIYDKLPDLQFSQILIEDISSVALDIITEQLKAKKLAGQKEPEFVIGDIDMIDVPTPDSLAMVMEKLYTLGFVSPISPPWEPVMEEMIRGVEDRRFGLTKLGAIASSFSLLPPESVRMILAAYSWECSILDVVTIAAYLSIDAKSFISTAPVESDNGPPVRANINWVPVYKLGLPGFISSSGMLYKIRLLIADEFIHGVFLFNALKYIIASSESRDSINNMRNWCTQNNISYRACLDFFRARDEIIEQMLTAGMDVFEQEEKSISRATENDLMDVITRLKYCIYDGYRNNLILRKGSDYFTTRGLQISPPKLFREDEEKLAETQNYGFVIKVLPTVLIYRELSLKYNPKMLMYDVVVDRISALDGFVSIDLDFTI